jgi:hypothetical protein
MKMMLLKIFLAGFVCAPFIDGQRILPNIGLLAPAALESSYESWTFGAATKYGASESCGFGGYVLVSQPNQEAKLTGPRGIYFGKNDTLQLIFRQLDSIDLNNATTIIIKLGYYYEITHTVQDNKWHNLRFKLPPDSYNLLPSLMQYSITVPKKSTPVVLYYFGVGEKALAHSNYTTLSTDNQEVDNTSIKQCPPSLNNIKKLPSIDLGLVENSALHLSASEFEARDSGPLDGFAIMSSQKYRDLVLESTSYLMLEKNYSIQIISRFIDGSYNEYAQAFTVTFKALIGRKTYSFDHRPLSRRWENNIFELPEGMLETLPAMYSMKVVGWQTVLYHVGIGDKASIAGEQYQEKSTTFSSQTTRSVTHTPEQPLSSTNFEIPSPTTESHSAHPNTTPEIGTTDTFSTTTLKTTRKPTVSTRTTMKTSTAASTTQYPPFTAITSTTPRFPTTTDPSKPDISDIIAKLFKGMGVGKLDLNIQFAPNKKNNQ